MISHTQKLWWVALLVCGVGLGCDKKASSDDKDKSEEASEKKKKKKDKDDDDDDKSKDKAGDDDKSGSPIAGRKKELAWEDSDFEKTKALNDVWDTKVPSCNAVLNACVACRDRIKSEESDMKLWSATVSECMKLKDAVLALDVGKRAAACASAKKAMKEPSDCVKGVYSAKGALE